MREREREIQRGEREMELEVSFNRTNNAISTRMVASFSFGFPFT